MNPTQLNIHPHTCIPPTHLPCSKSTTSFEVISHHPSARLVGAKLVCEQVLPLATAPHCVCGMEWDGEGFQNRTGVSCQPKSQAAVLVTYRRVRRADAAVRPRPARRARAEAVVGRGRARGLIYVEV